jgi:hypothetical protein
VTAVASVVSSTKAERALCRSLAKPSQNISAAPNTAPNEATSMIARSERTTFSMELPACEILVSHKLPRTCAAGSTKVSTMVC